MRNEIIKRTTILRKTNKNISSFEKFIVSQQKRFGDYGEVEIPVPIPNTEVKHPRGEGS